MLAVAQAVLENLGARAFPIKPGQKYPPLTEHGHKDASFDLSQIRAWWVKTPTANVGIACGESNFCVLDFDHIEDVPEWVKNLRTYKVGTVRGIHVYLRGARATAYMYNAEGKHIGEIKSIGGYVMAAGSIHPSGSTYTVIDDTNVTNATVELNELIDELVKNAPMKSSADASVNGPKIPCGQHDIQLHSIAGKLRSVGMEEEGIYANLVEICEKRCENYGADYLDMCRKHATNICKKPVPTEFALTIGGKLPEQTISATHQQLPAGFDANLLNLPKGKSTPFEELKDLSNKDQVSWIFQNVGIPEDELSDEPQSWLVHELLLEHGLHLFSGKPGSMKSLLALMLCKAACSAEPFLGRKNIGAPVKAVYIDHENPQSEVRKRCFGLGLLHLPNFRVWGDWREDEAPLVSFDDPRLIECAKRDKPFFVFDSLSSFLNGADENSAGEMMVIMKKAYALARMCAGVGILHHTPKNGPPSARGVGAIAATTDMSFIVQKSDRNVTLSEDRFRPCGNYTMGFSMDFGDMSGIYTATLTKDTTTSMPEAPVSRLEELKEKDRLATEAATEQHYKEKAVQVIQAAYAEGQAVCSRSVLCGLIGLSPDSAFAKRLLTGKDENPWTCVQNNRSLMFLPKGITEVPAKRLRIKQVGPEVLFSGPLHKVAPVAPVTPIDLNSTNAVSS
jgi:hypothetical protein